MIIAGNDEAHHDMIIHEVMKRASQNKAKFNNKNLSQFKVNKVKYMGNYYSEDELLPDPDKIKAIVEIPIPDGKPVLLRLLGMVKYLSRFIPNELEVTAPLRQLLKEDAQWEWLPEHSAALSDHC